jgi:aminocarboxymuconate-semialdehyde decarboxylase
MTIDLHTHILPENWPDLAKRYGYGGFVALEHLGPDRASGCCRARMMIDGKPFRTIEDNCWNPGRRIEECDRLGVSGQVLSTVPVMFSYWARPQDTLDLSRLLNDHVAGVCREFPSRFAGLGTIPMNAPDLAARELERCVRELGMPGVQIGSNVNGLNLGDERFEPVFAAAQELDACVFVHPWDMLGAAFAQTPERPAPPVMNERYRDFWAAWLVGMPAETCLAACSVLFSGLLDRLPRLRIGFAHGGGSLAGTLGRIDHGFHARPDLCQTRTARAPRSHFRGGQGGSPATPSSIYVDSLVHDADALRSLVRLVGADRVALGSDYPFPLGEDRPGELIASIAEFDEPTRRRLLSGTALEFLGRRGGALARGPARAAG